VRGEGGQSRRMRVPCGCNGCCIHGPGGRLRS